MLAKKILVPTDFSDCSTHALDYACELARTLDGKVQLVHCITPLSSEISLAVTQAMLEQLREGAEKALEKEMRARPNVRFDKPAVISMDPRDGIIELAQATKADLIVIGTHGRRGVSRLVLGSVTEYVVRHAPCPVLTLRGGES